jgi:hypothetical protein
MIFTRSSFFPDFVAKSLAIFSVTGFLLLVAGRIP